ncbi:MAG: CPBP family intramembrane metalloprotease [Anaerolineaceae bacterium]|nr:CPBP family intramembrane metalloprotease [Anaerolineaceae bacterium]
MKKTLSIIQANRLYLATMLLVVSAGAFLQSFSFSWGLLLTEILLILLPTLWMLHHNQIDLRESGGLKKTRASLLLVATLLGGGAWLVTSLVEILMVQISGYIPPTPEGILPTTSFQAALIFVGLVIAAPICEEILFRGTIQPAYQKQTTRLVSVLIPSLLFAFYHFRLLGLPSLLLISFLLGYTYWRTQSLTVTMVLHAANNFLAAIVMIRAGLFPGLELPFPSLPGGAFGIMMLVVGLVLLQRLIPHPQSLIERESEPAKLSKWKVLWPILLAGLLFIVVAGQEIAQAKQPVVLPLDGHQLPVSAQWVYEVQHKGGEKIGESICQWHQGETDSNLSCQREHEGFEIQSGNSYFSSMAGSSSLNIQWHTEDLHLVSLYQKNLFDNYENSWQVTELDENLQLSIQAENLAQDSLTFSPVTLVDEEWAWRLMGFDFVPGRTYKVEYLNPLTWRQETEDNGPLSKQEKLTITGPESISVPVGEFQAWKVTLSNGQSAWYSVEQPSILLRFESSMFDFLLVDEE